MLFDCWNIQHCYANDQNIDNTFNTVCCLNFLMRKLVMQQGCIQMILSFILDVVYIVIEKNDYKKNIMNFKEPKILKKGL